VAERENYEARAISASGPGSDPESLRVAYLDLLKLSLCDLAGAGTVSVGRSRSGRTFRRELTGEDRRPRTVGLDWPLNGLTMVGLSRLDDLQSCVESVVGDGIEGDLIEAGAWRGGASLLIRATLDSLGAADRTVWVADSFQGFPEPDTDEDGPGKLDLSAVDFLSVSQAEVLSHFERLGLSEGVRLVPGFFEETMPTLRGGKWSLIRLDGDTYDATRVSLDALYAGLSVGGYLVIDDYFVDECEQAVEDFRAEHGITEPIEQIDWTGVRWRRRDTNGPAPGLATGEPRFTSTATSPVPVDVDSARPRIPSLREFQLEKELADVNQRLEAIKLEVQSFRKSNR